MGDRVLTAKPLPSVWTLSLVSCPPAADAVEGSAVRPHWIRFAAGQNLYGYKEIGALAHCSAAYFPQ